MEARFLLQAGGCVCACKSAHYKTKIQNMKRGGKKEKEELLQSCIASAAILISTASAGQLHAPNRGGSGPELSAALKGES